MISRGYLQDDLSKLLSYDKLRKYNKDGEEGYRKTILRYKSILHNTEVEEMSDFYSEIFEEEKRIKQSPGWTSFREGKEDAIKDIAEILRQYLN